jgi:hypothetical protein
MKNFSATVVGMLTMYMYTYYIIYYRLQYIMHKSTAHARKKHCLSVLARSNHDIISWHVYSLVYESVYHNRERVMAFSNHTHSIIQSLKGIWEHIRKG